MPLSSVSARTVISSLLLGLAACSYSFQAGSGPHDAAGRPANAGPDAPASKPTRKPIADADPATPSEPAPSEPAPVDSDPTRGQPDEPPPVVEPQLTAVCRVDDESLAALCHRVFDPIAADDVDAWSRQLGDAVVLTRPTYRKGMQRLQGPQAVQEAAAAAGGLRALLHMRTTDRVVGTLSNDCRSCRRSYVAFEVNTRSGTVVVGVEMTQPPAVVLVEVGSHARRRHLEEVRTPPVKPPATVIVPKTEITPPAEDPSTEPTLTPTKKPAKKTEPTLTPTKKPARKTAPTLTPAKKTE